LERLVAMRTSQVFDEGGRLAGGAAAIRDITERTSPPHRHTVIAESPVMLEILKLIRRIGASEAGTVLLDGESGTGKDLVAKTLHYQSLRQAGPFIAVNCAAIPATLLESELFGYEKGAFTDALRTGGPGHALPGRDRGDSAESPGQAPARPGGADLPPPGRAG
jgi:transcriptional regulator with PAS, ATPase and Fis domain